MTSITPAQHQAAFLRALADHLDAHPDLAPVRVLGGRRTDLQLCSAHTAADLIAWARSLDIEQVHVQLISNNAYLHVFGELPHGHRVDVWDVPVDLDPADFTDDTVVSLDDSRLSGGAR